MTPPVLCWFPDRKKFLQSSVSETYRQVHSFMAKGLSLFSVWDRWSAELRITQCRFRMVNRKGKRWIIIREIVEQKVVREFSSGCWDPKKDEDIEACAKACLAAHRRGKWHVPEKAKKTVLDWPALADATMKNLAERVPREGSRRNAEGHLKEIAQFKGPITEHRLELWAKKKDPITQPYAFRNRIETLSHIHKTRLINLREVILKLREMRPTGSAKATQERATSSLKAIPTDEALQDWLDCLEGHEQWVCALIATYGLRPSEAWHAEDIDEKGWITIPGEGITKTDLHFAPPVPERWVERYKLRENFKRYQQELNERWSIRWKVIQGVRIPVNNSQVSNALYERMKSGRIKQLWVGSEWVRPYSLRHSYAIRCETSDELAHIAQFEFARWLGHGLDIHRRVYLKFMTPARKKESFVQRSSVRADSLTTDEIQRKLDKLEQLEKLLAS